MKAFSILLFCAAALSAASLDNSLYTVTPVDYQYAVTRTTAPAHTLSSLTVTAAIGEQSCGSFNVRAKAAVTGLTASLTNLTNSTTGHTLSADSMRLRAVEFVWVDSLHTSQIPMRLWDVTPQDLANGNNRQFWLNLVSKNPGDTGLFTGGVRVTDGGTTCTLSVAFRVRPFQLYDFSDYTFGAFLGTVRTIDQTTANDMKAHGIDGVQFFLPYETNLPGGLHYTDTSMLVQNINGNVHVEFHAMDSMLKFMKKAGMRGPIVPSFGNDYRGNIERDLCENFPQFHIDTAAVAVDGKQTITGPMNDPVFDTLYLSVVRQFKAKIESYGFEMVILVYDEPSKRLMTHLVYWSDKIHAAFPDLRRYGSVMGSTVYAAQVGPHADIIAGSVDFSGLSSYAKSHSQAYWVESWPMQCEAGLARGNFGIRYWTYHPEAAFFWALNYYTGNPYIGWDAGGRDDADAIVYPVSDTSGGKLIGTTDWEGVREARNDWAYAKSVEYLLAHDTGSVARAIAPKFTSIMGRLTANQFGWCGGGGYATLDSVRGVLAQWVLDIMKEAPGLKIETGEPGEVATQLTVEPTPFNPATTLVCNLAQSVDARLEVFDIRGKSVATLFSGRLEKGVHNFRFEGGKLSSGVYVSRLTAGKRVLVKTMTLLR